MIVVAVIALDAILLDETLVHLPYPRPLDAAQLLHTAPLRRLLPETERVHLAHHLEPRRIVQCQLGLIQQPVRPCPARLAGSIEPHPALADPYQQAPYPRRQYH